MRPGDAAVPFRLFVWNCAVSGAGSALVGWFFGWLTTSAPPLLAAALQGLFLGITVALALSLVDAFGNLPARPTELLLQRCTTAIVTGGVGGFFGGLLVQALYRAPFLGYGLGWGLAGLLIGAAPGLHDLLLCAGAGRDTEGARRKSLQGLLGGVAGGLIGGLLALFLGWLLQQAFASKPPELLWGPGAGGYLVLGTCLGLGFALMSKRADG
jgi:hypothetical protein